MRECHRARLSRLQNRSGYTGPALVVVPGYGRDPAEIVGISGLNMPRLAHEGAADYLSRLNAHVRATQGTALPFIGIAEYAGDDE
jgi:hypothetical protein